MNYRRLLKAIRRVQHLPAGMDLLKYVSNKIIQLYYKLIRSTKIAHPSSLMIELTNLCNLKCTTCPREYDFGDQMNKGSMSLDAFKTIIDEGYPYLDSVGLSGLGESFLSKHLVEAATYIRKKNQGIIISFSTNANTAQTVDVVSELAGTVDTIQISIDGVGKVYEEIRKEGNYGKFLENTKKISALVKNSRTELLFNFVAVKENYFQMADIIHLARDLGIGYVNLAHLNIVSISGQNETYYDFYSTDEFKNELRRAKKAASETPRVELEVLGLSSSPGFKNCRLPWSHHYITWDGFLAPCCSKPFPKELNFGNVIESSLITCLNSPESRDFRSLWYKNQTPEFCKGCHTLGHPAPR